MSRLKKNKYLVYLSRMRLPNARCLSHVEPKEKKKNEMTKESVNSSSRDISLRLDRKEKGEK